jgi:hypothetical protein
VQRYLPWNMTPQEREQLSRAQTTPPDPKRLDAPTTAKLE